MRLIQLIGVVRQGGGGEEVVVVEGHIDGHVGSDGWLDDGVSSWGQQDGYML